ncbi:MAG: cytochrome ubiquinol oxidase subunit I [Bacteroidota bacterium]|nr:cytochrome ubiquinol oxidase subunit I [Bacteroidota bacterium]
MLANIDLSLVNWSRAQFALTAMYHWLFVPLTLGLSFIVAFMETIYVRTGNPEWKRITKFWMTLFGINFAIGVATGIILEFEFGTNWSNYSWFVGDIFGAPLAIEGIMAFFMESTFIAVMFFGWNKVSPKFHLTSTWLVAIGANLSALWILVANAWMQNPVGMHFNPDTARNEMVNFWEVLFSPFAVDKFLHTITSGFTLAAIFVIGISAWFLLKKRSTLFARRSMLVAAVFGLLASIFTAFTGDSSARLIAQKQPMKFAAFEGLYTGSHGAPLMAFGVVSNQPDTSKNYLPDIKVKLEVPNLLSYLAYLDPKAFVPGINDLVYGNADHSLLPASEKIERGKVARNVLKAYKEAKEKGDEAVAQTLRAQFDDAKFKSEYFQYFGYGFLNDPKSLIPNVPMSFYSFHIMVFLGFYFILLFGLVLYFLYKGNIEQKRKFLWLAVLTLPLPYIAGQAGWIVAEVGRQPWVIQDYLPAVAAVSQIDASAVQITFWLFTAVFTALAIAEVSIMTKQIKIGPKEEGGN